MVKNKIYDSAKYGKLKILELGKVGVKILFYTGYKGKEQKVTMTIDELERLCGKLI